MHHQSLIAPEQAVVEVDHAADEFRRKDADASVVEQVDSLRRTTLYECRVVAEMRVAMDHAEPAERLPPRLEHRSRDAVASRDGVALVSQQLVAFEPLESKETLCRQRRPHARHPHLRGRRQHGAIERDMLCLTLVVEFLPEARAYFAGDLGGVDGGVHAAMNRE